MSVESEYSPSLIYAAGVGDYKKKLQVYRDRFGQDMPIPLMVELEEKLWKDLRRLLK